MSRPPCFLADKPPGEAKGGVLTSEARQGRSVLTSRPKGGVLTSEALKGRSVLLSGHESKDEGCGEAAVYPPAETPPTSTPAA